MVDRLPLKKLITYCQFRGDTRVQRPSLWFLALRRTRFYNSSMGGVDLMDQCSAAYRLDRKSFVKFYLCIFSDLMDNESIVTSFIT